METPKPNIVPPAPDRKGFADKLISLARKAADPTAISKIKEWAEKTSQALGKVIEPRLPASARPVFVKHQSKILIGLAVLIFLFGIKNLI